MNVHELLCQGCAPLHRAPQAGFIPGPYTILHFLNTGCSTAPDTAGHGPDMEYYMFYDHPGRVGTPRRLRTSSSPAAARQDINDPRVTVSALLG